MLNTEESQAGRSPESLAWAGLGNTYYWIDPAKRIAGVILTQMVPFADETVLHLFHEFETAVYAMAR
jgi:CubicO group peptidase (beta-lactamase class C family)